MEFGSPWLLQSLVLVSLVTSLDANADAKRLYDDLIMKGYNKHCRPVRRFSDVTIVRMGLSLSQIVKVDELNQIFTVNLWVEQDWQDVRFIWDPKQYNNITMLHVPIDKIWRPDIVLYNNADGDYTVTTLSKAIITPDGLVTWKPPMQFKSSCEMDVEYFPFDEQKCSMKFGPWTHDTTKVDITHRLQPHAVISDNGVVHKAIKMDEYQLSMEWDVMEASAKKNLVVYPCCLTTPYADVTFNITLKRRRLYYIYNLIIPEMSIIILTCLAFHLPSYSGEKISITISLFLSLSVFQLVMMELVPSTSLKLPLIGKHILMTLLMTTFSIMMNTVILVVNYRSTATHEMSDFTRLIFLKVLPKFLQMKQPEFDTEEETDSKKENEKPSTDNYIYRQLENKFFGESSRSLHTTFIGVNKAKLNLDKFCNACVQRGMRRYAPNMQKGLDGGWFIAQHYSDENDSKKVKDEWRYVALVIDRILLLVYLFVSGTGAFIICLNAPALYDNRTPLTTGSSTPVLFPSY